MFERLHYVLPRVVRLPLFVALVLLLPVLFYHFLEEPMTLLGKRVAKRFEKTVVRSQLAAVAVAD
jgi:peptidoglycan/LPS O-acetylase OafA/YrhL